ncbi:DNA translocase FtsK [Duganella violaceipulchra]|nr:DNA translocase FtsK [Duganella violaceicalia]
MRLGGIPDGDGSATDPLYPAAVALVREQDRASISLVQRVLRITYNRASSLLQAMEAADVVGSTQGVYVVANVAGVAA